MGHYFLKPRRSRTEMEAELHQLREKNLRLRLDLDVMVLTPDSRRAKKIREDRIIQLGCGSMIKTPPAMEAAQVTDVKPEKIFFR